MIHDKTGEPEWSNVENFRDEFSDGDVVVADGYASFKTMYVVSKIEYGTFDDVIRYGVFWAKKEAERYAELIDND